MPEETKALLRAIQAERRALRKTRPNRSPKAGGIGKESEDMVMSKGTLEALQDARENERPAATKTREPKKEKIVKTATKAKKTVKKAAPKSGERKAVTVAKPESKPAGSMFIFGQSVTSVLRWMGKDGFTFEEAKAALKTGKVSKMPADGTISIQIGAGKRGERGEPAKLSAEDQKVLRDAAKVIEAKKD
jgi:hypothetical protein